MKLHSKYIWKDPIDQTVDNEVLVFIGKDGTTENGSIAYFSLEGGDGSVWVGLEEDELDWIEEGK